ncbi:aspartyl protease family protein [Paenibacillus taichungensis]|uniref:aspartyl protease family protein n=1 Tax=Paenibacillus taichungensis TaxID=484184 RepID=UPI00287146C6|nr:aspartyl protease family protein [Paenibacillus taichungensis]MDR9744360.1 aspartyl protease family protein [Paenibacillus taichungensis]
MRIRLVNGLPIIEVLFTYQNQSVLLPNVLLDTGCATTIFDIDLIEPTGLTIDPIQGRAVGIGGQSELSFQQPVHSLTLNHHTLNDFVIQLGQTKEPYGFDGILGVDFLSTLQLNIDFKDMVVRKP